MEVKIGISDSPRELVITSSQTQEEVEKLVSGALGGKEAVISLTDEKGRKYLIQAAKISYIEIGTAAAGRVGFAAV
ncbi:DUF3107 domain-containing protein [Nocardia alni]|uniref:DUF3107 domain-containing protein n=1 Tax=Nocardia alni TaxID=2815723 RepID=UPI001C21DFAF|nr:DUF3107 domain-containing protein [Nocardia alni]